MKAHTIQNRRSSRMRKVLCIAATLAVVAEPIAARSDWPSERPLKVIVPYTAGGPSDTVTRAIAKRLAERIGQNIVVENRPGANSALGIGQAAQMPADGYTFVTVLPAFLINSNLNKNIPYKLQDLAPVSLMADMPLFLFTNKDVPGQTIADMVKYFRSNPGKANYASSGEGSSAHLTGSYFALRNGLQMTHVPYKGASQFLPDLVSGQVSMVFDAMVLEMPYVKEGKLKALAIASRNRYPDAPDIPTMQESGYPGFIMGSWAGLMAPAGTPAAAIERMSREIAEIVKQPEVVATFKHLGFLPMGTSPQEFKSFLNDETERYAKILKDSNVKPE